MVQWLEGRRYINFSLGGSSPNCGRKNLEKAKKCFFRFFQGLLGKKSERKSDCLSCTPPQVLVKWGIALRTIRPARDRTPQDLISPVSMVSRDIMRDSSSNGKQ